MAKAARRPHSDLVVLLGLGTSGLTMTLLLYLLAPASDYRYILWLVAAGRTAGLVHFCQTEGYCRWMTSSA
jgi:hypothetical protein